MEIEEKEMSLSQLSSKCKACPFVSKCSNKRLEALAIASADVHTDIARPLMVKHDYRDIKVAENTTVTVDLEVLKKNMKDAIYKNAGLGLDYGA